MKKRTLVSLLAIPIFSLATTLNSFSIPTFNSYQESQESKKIKPKAVAAGVIDFLLRSPKTANKMNPDEKLTLDIIRDLLKTQDQREHELDYAAAGRSQFTINTTDGRQAQFVKDESGNIYLVMDGVIYPIAQELVYQASNLPTIENATLPSYDLNDLESRINSNPKEDSSIFYRTQKGGEYLSDIAEKFGVPIWNIFRFTGAGAWVGGRKDPKHYIPIYGRKLLENKKKIKASLLINKEEYINEISAVFSYKWHQDLNDDGELGFNEFNQIKRTFYNDEDFNIGIDYQTEKHFKGNLELKILDDYTGNLIINQKMEIFSNGPMAGQQQIPVGSLPIGVYLIHANLINAYSGGTVSSKTEKFEIVQNPSKTPDKK